MPANAGIQFMLVGRMNDKAPVVLVTGAARRVGAAIARTLHAAGWKVAVHYRASSANARTLVTELNAARAGSAIALHANLLERSAIDRLVMNVREHWGRLDALVNNASSYYRTPLTELTGEQFNDLVGSNLEAPLFLIQACAKYMTEGGAIVNITDAHAAARPRAGYSAYLAAKAGLVSLTESLALELAPKIRINAVAPGHVLWADANTMTEAERAAELARVPLRRLVQPEEVGAAVAFLLSPAAGAITGATLPVDGGLRLA